MYNKDELYHYGTPRHSGRYPWGSGENPYQRTSAFSSKVSELRKSGISDVDIARGFGMSTTELRKELSYAKDQQKQATLAEIQRLKDKGYSDPEIYKRLGMSESTYRGYKNEAFKERSEKVRITADMLKEQLKTKKYLDVGPGTEIDLGITETKLKTALTTLESEGYAVKKIMVEQAGNPGKFTTVKILCPKDTQVKDIYKNLGDIHTIDEKIIDVDGTTKLGLMNTKGVSSKRVAIRYAEDGGNLKDGVIELRRGVDDISLKDAQYAQVRIAVDGTHFLKGMAMYSDDLPKGVDILFNTNKSKSVPMMSDDKNNTVLKPMKKDKDNPFGATIKDEEELKVTQRYYIDKNGKKQLSAINIVNEPGDWDTWSRTLSSQFLSKQNTNLIKKQLNLAYAEKKDEFEEIKNLTNPTIKKKLLESFADDCDASAVHLKAAALPRQSNKVILPITTLKEDQIYAPGLENGTRVVLIRHPHAGTFEIPELTVNNRNSVAKSVMNNSRDAVGINAKVAQRLSGADFDGDTVIVIPITNAKGDRTVSIRTTQPLAGLKNFDPQEQYKGYPGMKTIKESTKQNEMGVISNLITDMTLKGATEDELVRAVKHSMVVIDAEKHNLDYKRSEKENNITALKKKYQIHNDGVKYGGSSTLISRAKSEVRVDERSQLVRIDKETGEKIYTNTGRTYMDKKGNIKKYQTKSTKMAEAKDARDLISEMNTPQERAYADYANQMKALGNAARKELISTGSLQSSASAKKTYAAEVASLDAQLQVALKNAPRERHAQIFAKEVYDAKVKDNPDLTKEEKKKIKIQALATGRTRFQARKQPIKISDREWEAIQAGAISETKLMKILNNTDMDALKERATPRADNRGISDSKVARIKSMANSGYTLAEIAKALGVSTSTVSDVIA